MTFTKEFIVCKSDDIIKYRGEMHEVLSNADKKIFTDFEKMHTLERLLQLIVDNMIDINQHIIKEKRLEVGDDLQSTFTILADHRVLPKKFATKIAPIVGLRNRIVHRYESLDKRLFVSSLRKNFEDVNKYLRYINQYLQK